MPHFTLTCLDKPGALDLRMATREAHLAYLKAPDTPVRLAGPFMDDQGQIIGSLLIIEADDMAAAKTFSGADPYQGAGLFQSVEIRPFRLSIGQL